MFQVLVHGIGAEIGHTCSIYRGNDVFFPRDTLSSYLMSFSNND